MHGGHIIPPYGFRLESGGDQHRMYVPSGWGDIFLSQNRLIRQSRYMPFARTPLFLVKNL
jgi:hypothetical protein